MVSTAVNLPDIGVTLPVIGAVLVIDYGDISYDPISSSLIIVGRARNMGLAIPSPNYIVDPITGVVKRLFLSEATQLARGPQNIFYTTLTNSSMNSMTVATYDLYTGATVALPSAASLQGVPADMAGYICEPC